MRIEDITKEQVKEMSDEEVRLWFAVAQEQEQTNKMRQGLLKLLDLREVDQQVNTIKIPSRTI